MVIEEDEFVRVWLGDRYEVDYSDETSRELPPSFTLTVEQMNALVVEWLRGPAGTPGPQGPMGPMGSSS